MTLQRTAGLVVAVLLTFAFYAWWSHTNATAVKIDCYHAESCYP
jgi:hypothetical protein